MPLQVFSPEVAFEALEFTSSWLEEIFLAVLAMNLLKAALVYGEIREARRSIRV